MGKRSAVAAAVVGGDLSAEVHEAADQKDDDEEGEELRPDHRGLDLRSRAQLALRALRTRSWKPAKPDWPQV